ncbi:MAG: homoserine kinase, partial [Gemmatimonadota bacterium]
DVLGMAVDAFLVVEWRPGEHPLEVVRGGTLADAGWTMEEDLVVQVMREVSESKALIDLGIRGIEEGAKIGLSGHLHLRSEIPVGRGLGSSAAARVAGSVLRRLLTGVEVTRSEIIQEAAEGEGHPDNAAPAVLGGLVAATRDPRGRVTAVPLPLSLRPGWVFAMPGVPLSTRAAREALPGSVTHAAATRNAGRLGLLIPALAAGDADLLALAMEDELHVPHRIPLIPGAESALAAARTAGAWAATLSGAGSGLMAVTAQGEEETVGRAMARAFDADPRARGGSYRVLRPWLPGVQWGSGPLRPPGPERFATSRA